MRAFTNWPARQYSASAGRAAQRTHRRPTTPVTRAQAGVGHCCLGSCRRCWASWNFGIIINVGRHAVRGNQPQQPCRQRTGGRLVIAPHHGQRGVVCADTDPAMAPLWLKAVTLVRTPPTNACKACTDVGPWHSRRPRVQRIAVKATAEDAAHIGDGACRAIATCDQMRQIHGIASRLRDKARCRPVRFEQMPTTYPESLTFRPTHCGPEDAPISCMAPPEPREW